MVAIFIARKNIALGGWSIGGDGSQTFFFITFVSLTRLVHHTFLTANVYILTEVTNQERAYNFFRYFW